MMIKIQPDSEHAAIIDVIKDKFIIGCVCFVMLNAVAMCDRLGSLWYCVRGGLESLQQ